MTCSALHSSSPTLCCDRAKDHDGWHFDGTYGWWLPVGWAGHANVGVVMPTAAQVRRFNEAVSGYYDGPETCVGVLAAKGVAMAVGRVLP